MGLKVGGLHQHTGVLLSALGWADGLRPVAGPRDSFARNACGAWGCPAGCRAGHLRNSSSFVGARAVTSVRLLRLGPLRDTKCRGRVPVPRGRPGGPDRVPYWDGAAQTGANRSVRAHRSTLSPPSPHWRPSRPSGEQALVRTPGPMSPDGRHGDAHSERARSDHTSTPSGGSQGGKAPTSPAANSIQRTCGRSALARRLTHGGCASGMPSSPIGWT